MLCCNPWGKEIVGVGLEWNCEGVFGNFRIEFFVGTCRDFI